MRLVTLVGALAMLSGALLGAPSASAVSDYDNNFNVVDQLITENPAFGNYYGTCEPSDRSTDWSTFLTTDRGLTSETVASFNNAIDNGRWGVSSFYEGQVGQAGSARGYSVYWTEDTSLYLDWDDHPDLVYAKGTNLHVVRMYPEKYIRFNGLYGCDPYVYDQVSDATGGTAVSNSSVWEGTDYSAFFFYGTNNLPEGYEGSEIPSGYEAFGGKLAWQVVGKVGTFRLKNITGDVSGCRLVVDDNPAVDHDDGGLDFSVYEWANCKDETAISHVWKELGYYDVTLEYTRNDKLESFTYKINVDGTDKGGEFGEDADENIEGAIGSSGDVLSACFTETFPFVDMPACIENLQTIGNMLSFGAFSFGSKLEVTPCRSLTVVDDWLNLDDPYVCPMIPAYVRTVTTPFVGFALGLLMIRFLSKQDGEKY